MQREGALARGLEPPSRIALDRPRHDRAELGGRQRIERIQIRLAVVQQACDHFLRRSAGEQPAPGQHLVEHAAEREDVAAPVDAAADHLLGRHVAERAEDDPLRRMRDGRAVGGHLRTLEPLQREAEVQNLHRAVRRQEDVLRLQVAMDHAARVRGRQAVGDGGGDPNGLAPRADALRDPRTQRLAFEQLHHRDGHAVDHGELVNGQDARMRQRRDCAGLDLEAPPHLGIGGDMIGHDLERHVAAEAQSRAR